MWCQIIYREHLTPAVTKKAQKGHPCDQWGFLSVFVFKSGEWSSFEKGPVLTSWRGDRDRLLCRSSQEAVFPKRRINDVTHHFLCLWTDTHLSIVQLEYFMIQCLKHKAKERPERRRGNKVNELRPPHLEQPGQRNVSVSLSQCSIHSSCIYLLFYQLLLAVLTCFR